MKLNRDRKWRQVNASKMDNSPQAQPERRDEALSRENG